MIRTISTEKTCKKKMWPGQVDKTLNGHTDKCNCMWYPTCSSIGTLVVWIIKLDHASRELPFSIAVQQRCWNTIIKDKCSFLKFFKVGICSFLYVNLQCTLHVHTNGCMHKAAHNMHTQTHTNTHTHTQTYTCMPRHTQHIYVHTCIHICTLTYTSKHVCVHAHRLNVYTHPNIDISTVRITMNHVCVCTVANTHSIMKLVARVTTSKVEV